MRIEIKNRFSGAIVFSVEAESWKIALEIATRSYANLSDANLRGADLSDADLSYADLSYADLSDANLRGADLRGADLSDANLRGADLSDADLSYADLSYADLSDANLRGADLSDADLSDADLSDADLRGAKSIPEAAIAQSRILPDGDIIGWKKCQNDIIVKLLIPASSKRSHAFARKCRAQHVKVLEVFGAKTGVSKFKSDIYNIYTSYTAGETVACDKWEEDFTIECGGGIHFFITRLEAEQY